jgi:hypothetical protein
MSRQIKINPQQKPRQFSYASNSVGAREVFKERKKYDLSIMPDFIAPHMASTWTKDRFYGLVNTSGNAVVVRSHQLKGLRYTGGQESLYALNFVADAWRDLAARLRKLAAQNIIYENSPWSAPVAMKAWTPLTSDYDKYMKDVVYPVFRQRYAAYGKNDAKIRNINSFMEIFDGFAQTTVLKAGPLTLSGWVESSHANLRASGLMIEIALDPYDEDLNKAYKFGDRNFSFVANIAAEYGFIIDKNIPWRLVADISNPAMQEYMTGVPIVGFEVDNVPEFECEPLFITPADAPMAYGYSQIPGKEDVLRHISFFQETVEGNIQEIEGYRRYKQMPIQPLESGGHADIWESPLPQKIFEIFYQTDYRETWAYDAEFLSNYLLLYYNTYILQKPHVTLPSLKGILEECGGSQSVMRHSISPAAYDDLYGARWNIKTFYVVRLIERNISINNQRKVHELQQALNIYDFTPPQTAYLSALKYVQEKFIGPYDTDPLTLGRVGDIIERKRVDSVFSNP